MKYVNKDLMKNGRRVFESEYAAVKAFRAWTYLQLVLVYGQVPLFTEPLLTEEESQAAMRQNLSDVNAVCNYFIDDNEAFVRVVLQISDALYSKTYTVNSTDESKWSVRTGTGDL